MSIREACDSDLDSVLAIERAAFGSDDEATLVSELLNDPSAKPLISLLAFQDGVAVGHILFTAAHLEPESSLSIALLAPLAVTPAFQRQGIGGRLIEHGVQLLAEAGIDLVFVLGHPEYYPRHGFTPAGKLGFDAPFPIPAEHAPAWMVAALGPDALAVAGGRVVCADALNKPHYWPA